MEAPKKIWINPSVDLPKLNGVIDKESVEYIRKDIVEGMLATAEVHAYFTGGESEREKLALKKDAFIEKACDAYCKVCGHYPHTVPTHICRQDCQYFSDFKRHIEEE